MNTTHEILANMDILHGHEPRGRYSRKRVLEMIDEGLIVPAPENITFANLFTNHIKFTNERRPGGARIIAFPVNYRIPRGDGVRRDENITDIVYMDPFEDTHYPLHRERNVRSALENKVGEDETILRRHIVEQGIKPETVVPYALANATSFPEIGWGIPRDGALWTEPRAKLGLILKDFRQRFFIIPYISAIDADLLLARTEDKTLPEEQRGYVSVDRPARNRKTGELEIIARVTPEAGSSNRPRGGAYKIVLHSPPLVPTPKNLSPTNAQAALDWIEDSTRAAYNYSADCDCKDFHYRANLNRIVKEQPTKLCKHIGVVHKKSMRLFSTVHIEGDRHQWVSNPVPTFIGDNGAIFRLIHQLRKYALIENEDGGLRPLNRTELSAIIGAAEQYMIRERGKPTDYFAHYGPTTRTQFEQIKRLGQIYNGRIDLPR